MAKTKEERKEENVLLKIITLLLTIFVVCFKQTNSEAPLTSLYDILGLIGVKIILLCAILIFYVFSVSVNKNTDGLG